MSFMFVIGHCVNCDQFISFNPHKVPSIRRTPEGPREALCRACAERWNELHPESARPIPDGAYAAEEVNL